MICLLHGLLEYEQVVIYTSLLNNVCVEAHCHYVRVLWLLHNMQGSQLQGNSY